MHKSLRITDFRRFLLKLLWTGKGSSDLKLIVITTQTILFFDRLYFQVVYDVAVTVKVLYILTNFPLLSVLRL